VGLAITLAAVAAGLVGGGLAGYRMGEIVRGSRRSYWVMNVGVLLVCAVLDFTGLVLGRPWLAYGALGLMAGLITGMKYGYSDSIRVWQAPESTGEEGSTVECADEDAEVTTPTEPPAAERCAGRSDVEQL
jgi:hypothetical protein